MKRSRKLKKNRKLPVKRLIRLFVMIMIISVLTLSSIYLGMMIEKEIIKKQIDNENIFSACTNLLTEYDKTVPDKTCKTYY